MPSSWRQSPVVSVPTPKYDAVATVKMALNRAMKLELTLDKTVELILAGLRQQDWLRTDRERDWFEAPSITTRVSADVPTDNERPI